MQPSSIPESPVASKDEGSALKRTLPENDLASKSSENNPEEGKQKEGEGGEEGADEGDGVDKENKTHLPFENSPSLGLGISP